MAQTPTHKLLGLVRDTNAHETPPGALDVAKNVVFRRADVAEPRPGFERNLDGPGSQVGHDQDVMQLFAWGSTRYGAMDNLAFCRVSATAATLTNAAATGYYSTSAVPMRKNLYVNTATGLQKLTSTSDDAFEKAHGLGIPVVWGALSGGTVAMADGDSYAYRALIARKDANGVWSYGVPSGRTILDNNSGGAASAAPRVYLPATGCAAGDVLMVYRSRVAASSTDPDDELGHVYEFTLTSTEITAGYVSVVEKSTDNERGAALYTNPSRGGIAAANFEPPYAKALDEYRECLFAANTVGPWRLTLTFDEGGSRTSSATGIGYRAISGTRTNGSATITLSNTTGLQVGMIISSASISSWSGTGPVRVVTVSAGVSVTMNATWNGSTDGAPAQVIFHDSIRVGSEYFPVCANILLSSHVGAVVLAMNTTLWSAAQFRTVPSTTFRSFALGNACKIASSVVSYTLRNNVQFAIEEVVPKSTDTAPQVWATHGDEYYPALPLPSASTGRAMERDARPNGLSWSKQYEPAHFPIANYVMVGDAQAAILAIKRAGESLYVFQDNGDVWRVYGFGPASGWQTNQVARGVTLLGPRSCDVMGETVYCNAEQGVFAVDANGAVNLSDKFIGNDLRGVAASTSDPRWLVCNPVHKEIVLGVSSLEGNTTPYTYCFNVGTARWSSWELVGVVTDAACVGGAYSYGVYGGTYKITMDQSASSGFAAYTDGEYTIVASVSNGAGSYDYTKSGINTPYSASVGDRVYNLADQTYYFITAVTDANTFVLGDDTVGIIAPSTSLTVYKSYECELTWRAIGGGSANTRKRFASFEVSAQNITIARRVEMTYDSDHSSEATQTKVLDVAGYPRAFRAVIGRPHARARWIKPGIRIVQAGCNFKIEGMQLEYEHITHKVSR